MSQTKATLIGDATTGTLTIGSGETLAFAGGGSTNELMFDAFRLTSNLIGSAGSNMITANLERNDTAGTNGIINGTMSESSGVFTFPHTGIYEVKYQLVSYSSSSQGTSKYVGAYIHSTENNSSYTLRAYGHNNHHAASYYSATTITTRIDITDTANQKVKFDFYIQGACTALGGTSDSSTSFFFTRLGDT